MLVFHSNFSHANDPNIVTNREKGKWELESSRELLLKTDLTLGVRDGDEDLMFGRPTKIVVDSKDNLYVLDHGYQLIRKYNAKGEYLLTVGRQGEGPGEYPNPLTIAVDRQDRLYVAGLGTRISIYDESGNHLNDFKHDFPGSVIKSLAADSQDNIYLVCIDLLDQNMIHKYNAQGEYLISFCESYAIGMSVDTRVENIYAGGAINIDSSDHIFYTQSAPYEIRKFTSEGRLLTKIFRENSFLPPPPDLDVNDGGKVVISAPTTSTAIIVFDDGTFINVVRKHPHPDLPGKVFIDYFSSDGELLTQVSIERNMDIEYRDGSNRLYAIDMEEYPMVVRYVFIVE
jgi:hypothetical protein